MELGIPCEYENRLQYYIVKQGAINTEGIHIRYANDNPFMYLIQYEVELLYGETDILAANIIVENILAQVDQDEHR